MRAAHLAAAAASFGALLALSAAAEEPRGVLARFSFDDGLVETGPDTFRVFANAKGSVTLSRAYRWSGDFSVEIRDAAGDADFPELQGRFPAVSAGTLYAHFAFLTATREDEWNVALAGPAGFRLGPNGIALWLRAREGFLRHTSDSMEKKLFALEPFTWYVVDATYRVDSGTYDLAIRREGDARPLVDLSAQPNAASQPGSAVDTFSFTGDVEDDESNVVFYVDDVLIGTDREVVARPFVAPGRRRSFVESLLRERSLLFRGPACLAFSDPSDLGLLPPDVAALRGAAALELLEKIATGSAPPPRASISAFSGRPREILEAAHSWREGCAALAIGRSADALRHFESAEKTSRGPLVLASSAAALAAMGRPDDADARLAEAAPQWRSDARALVALAAVGAARGDLIRAEEILRTPAERLAADRRDPEHEGAAACTRDERMLAEEYFAALLVNGFTPAAAAFASRMAIRAAPDERLARTWTERRGDAAFFDGDLDGAARFYEAVAADSPGALLKLADVAWSRGDAAKERALRERIYGTLLVRPR